MSRSKPLLIAATCAAALFLAVAAYALYVIAHLGVISPYALAGNRAHARSYPALLAIRAQPEFIFDEPWNPDRISWIEQLRLDTGADEITISYVDDGARVLIRSREPWQDETGQRQATIGFELFVDKRRGVWQYNILNKYD